MVMSSGIDVGNRMAQLRAWDVAHVWHPFTPMQAYRQEESLMASRLMRLELEHSPRLPDRRQVCQGTEPPF